MQLFYDISICPVSIKACQYAFKTLPGTQRKQVVACLVERSCRSKRQAQTVSSCLKQPGLTSLDPIDTCHPLCLDMSAQLMTKADSMTKHLALLDVFFAWMAA